MKILVAGATGKTGTRLVNELRTRSHAPIALVRESSDTSKLPVDTELRRADLTDLPEGVCDDCDAVIFAAGSGGDTDAEMTEKVDREGAKDLVDQAVSAKIQRFVMLSSAGAEDPNLDSEMGHYLKAKHDADEHLKHSGLSFAILRPVKLTDEEGERNLRFGQEVQLDAEAARGDVASVLADAVESSRWENKVARMQSA